MPARRFVIASLVALSIGIVANLAWYPSLSGNARALRLRSDSSLHSLVMSETKAVWSQYGLQATLLQIAPRSVLVVPLGFDKNTYAIEGFTRVRVETRDYDPVLDVTVLDTIGESRTVIGKGNFLRWSWDEETRDYVVMWSPRHARVHELWLYVIDETVYFIDGQLLDVVVQ